MKGYGGRGPSSPQGARRFRCLSCGYEFEVPYGQPKPLQCPNCGAPPSMIVRIDRGYGRGWRYGQRRGKGFGGVFKQAKW